jgi:hypothetical protein
MKKLALSVLAVAALSLAMTSCNKSEENNATLKIGFENNEILSGSKTSVTYDGVISWVNNDRIGVYDQAKARGQFRAIPNGNDPRQATFVYVASPNNVMPDLSTNLYGFYPYSINHSMTQQRWRRCEIPKVQTTQSGELNNFPMYAYGNVNNFKFKNFFGVARILLTADKAVKSIAITTEQYVAGVFDVTYVEDNTAADGWIPAAQSVYPTIFHTDWYAQRASKTATLNVTNPVENNQTPYCIYLPPATYNTFKVNITFTDNSTYEKTYSMPVTIDRTTFSNFPINIE